MANFLKLLLLVFYICTGKKILFNPQKTVSFGTHNDIEIKDCFMKVNVFFVDRKRAGNKCT